MPIRIMHTLASALLAALLFAGAAHADDADGRFRIKGVGGQSCKQYLAFDKDSRLVVETWWAGFVTALNIERRDTYDILSGVSVEQVNAWLVAYCGENKDDLLAVAVYRLAEYYFPRRAKSSPNH